MRATVALASVFLLGACAGAAPPDEPGSSALSDALATGVAIHAYEGGTLAVTGRLTSPGEAEQVGRTTLSIVDASGWLQSDPDGALWLEELELQLDDVVVALFGTQVHVTGLRLSLAEPATAFAGVPDPDTGRVEWAVPVSFELSWAVREADGRVRQLPLARLSPLALAMTLEQNPLGLLVAHVDVTGEGEVWSWRGVLHLDSPRASFDVTDHPRSHPID